MTLYLSQHHVANFMAPTAIVTFVSDDASSSKRGENRRNQKKLEPAGMSQPFPSRPRKTKNTQSPVHSSQTQTVKKSEKKPVESPIQLTFSGREDDILQIHQQMIQYFHYRREYKLFHLEKEIESFKTKHKQPWSRSIGNRFKTLEEQHIHYYFDLDGGKYLYRTEMAMDVYKKIISKSMQVNFMSQSKIEQKEMRTLQMLRRVLMSALAEHTKITSLRQMLDNNSCQQCGKHFDTDVENKDSITCQHCGSIFNTIISHVFYKDVDRINVNARYRYSEYTYFKECILQWQGKQNKKIPESVNLCIRKYMVIYNIDDDGLTKDLIVRFLKLDNLDEYKEDVDLIHARVVNKTLPDISHLETKLAQMFHEFEDVYEKANTMSRDNFPNGFYLLFQFLRILKYPCTHEDFFALKSLDRLREHDVIFENACELLGGEWKNNYRPTA
jgi:hypothetical protein